MSMLSGLGSAAGDIRSSYLNLLITQLKYQDPTNPMDNNQMAMQLTQLSQLEQMQEMNAAQQMNEATSLIGKEIQYVPKGAAQAVTGTVSGVQIMNGQATMTVGADQVPVSGVQAITGTTFAKTLLAQEMNQSSNLLGKHITFAVADTAATNGYTMKSGTVTGVQVVNGAIQIVSGDYVMDPGAITSITN